MALRVFLSASIWMTICWRLASTSGFSLTTTSPSNYSYRPEVVTVKLIRVTLMQTSGG